MLQLKQLAIGYKDSAPVVCSIDAELHIGEFGCLLGRNGTGKSTLLRTIAGIQSPLSGTIQHTAQAAIVLTQVPTLNNTTVREMVAYGRLGQTDWLGRLKATDYEAADRAMATVGIEEMASRLFCNLSDGEKQKTMIARALAQETPLLLLDEPSAFLDFPSRRELMKLLRSLTHDNQKSILLSTHDVELAAQYADKLWIIQDHRLKGKAPQEFNPEEL